MKIQTIDEVMEVLNLFQIMEISYINLRAINFEMIDRLRDDIILI